MIHYKIVFKKKIIKNGNYSAGKKSILTDHLEHLKI